MGARLPGGGPRARATRHTGGRGRCPLAHLCRSPRGHRGLATRIPGPERGAGSIARHGDDARNLHLQLRPARTTRSPGAGRGRPGGAARDAAEGALDAQGADGRLMAEPPSLEELARRAVAGERDAVSGLLRALQGDVYGLALRILWQREDAEDATQEILIRVITRLSQFDFRSKLKTWVYRIAVNHILDVKKSPVERMELTFERFGRDLADGLSSEGPGNAERSLFTEEVKVGCTIGMPPGLDRPHRLAYILGEIFELPGPES